MQVREFNNTDADRWDKFVKNCDHSAPHHLSAWKYVMEEVFNSKTRYLLAEENGNISGIFPLIHIRSFVGGNYFTSLPGGICARSDEAAFLLLEHAKEFVKQYSAEYLILRDGRKMWDLPELKTNEEHVTFEIEVPSSLDQIKKAMKKRTRQLINQASNNNLETSFGMENLEDYYPIYSKAMQEKGTPTQGLEFFKSIAAHFPTESNLLTINQEKKILGGGFIAPYKQTIFCTWSGLLRDYYHLRISHLLVWETIKFAYENKYNKVDLGRCKKDSGGFGFKKNFGGKPLQLFQQVYLNKLEKPPQIGKEMENSPSYRAFVNIWRRLPESMVETYGPKIRKQIPFG